MHWYIYDASLPRVPDYTSAADAGMVFGYVVEEDIFVLLECLEARVDWMIPKILLLPMVTSMCTLHC